ncbi:MAG: DUF1569 domain-containing protein [Planctomycetota bacterium]|nr:DUF1569 domain-containing protein [Planctomycetota bacterium]
MRNLLNDPDREALLARMADLRPDSKGRWGVLTVEQMVCHVTDPVRIALGELEVQDASNVFTRSFLKWMVLAGMPPPKGKIDTFPELDYKTGGGRPPEGLAPEIETFRATLDRFTERAQRAQRGEAFAPSPVFGKLSARAYGRLFHAHTHHHLKQFGV